MDGNGTYQESGSWLFSAIDNQRRDR
jgi:hypothetical protein